MIDNTLNVKTNPKFCIMTENSSCLVISRNFKLNTLGADFGLHSIALPHMILKIWMIKLFRYIRFVNSKSIDLD